MTKKSTLKIVEKYWRYLPKEKFDELGGEKKGIYALFNKQGKKHFDVIYVGMSGATMRGRLKTHRNKKGKGNDWTHFSAFELKKEVSSNSKLIKELEGLFLEIYAKDTHANSLNRQHRYRAFDRVIQ